MTSAEFASLRVISTSLTDKQVAQAVINRHTHHKRYVVLEDTFIKTEKN